MGNIAASVVLQLFINGIERYHTNAPTILYDWLRSQMSYFNQNKRFVLYQPLKCTSRISSKPRPSDSKSRSFPSKHRAEITSNCDNIIFENYPICIAIMDTS